MSRVLLVSSTFLARLYLYFSLDLTYVFSFSGCRFCRENAMVKYGDFLEGEQAEEGKQEMIGCLILLIQLLYLYNTEYTY